MLFLFGEKESSRGWLLFLIALLYLATFLSSRIGRETVRRREACKYFYLPAPHSITLFSVPLHHMEPVGVKCAVKSSLLPPPCPYPWLPTLGLEQSCFPISLNLLSPNCELSRSGKGETIATISYLGAPGAPWSTDWS